MPGAGTRLLLLLGVVLIVGCASGDLPVPPAPAPADRADWMTDDPAGWPSIAMINRIEYTDGKHESAACGFLIDTGDEIVAATAKHVLTYFKSEAMDSVSFRSTLVRWEMVPKDQPEKVVTIGRLINQDQSEPLDEIPSGRDWLLFTLRKRAELAAVAQPLRLRDTPLVKGETVYVIGWRYPDEGRQHVHRGRFVRMHEEAVLIDVETLAGNKIPGLSGSPVIDGSGRVIGLMSTGYGKLQRLAPASYAIGVLAGRTPADPGA